MHVHLRKEEKVLKIALLAGSAVFFLLGWVFVLFPEGLVRFINYFSVLIVPSWRTMPMPSEKLWLSLAFSMMMTIALISYVAGHNVRKYKGLVLALLTAKLSSSLSALIFFITAKKYFAYLLVFLVDGGIFLLYAVLLVWASKKFLEDQTGFFYKMPGHPVMTGPAKVVVQKGEDKFKLLDQVLKETDFFKILDRRCKESGKSKANFLIAVKPNFMYLHHRKDISTYTDPALVEYLIDRIWQKGYVNIALVEAQSTYGNYYNNREVVKVAEYAGYSRNKNYRIVDLTEEMVPYDYGGRLGKHFVGPTWRDADFRISFAKNKTHVFCNYTLTLKNIYGTLPMQNKLKEYHTRREYDWPTIESMKHFPVHFGLIDAIYSADGQFGVIVDPTPKKTDTIIGGENLIAVDWVGAKKMGLNPDDPHIGRFLPLAIGAFGKPDIKWAGDQSVYESWVNVSDVFIKSLDVIEESYAFANWWFDCLVAMDKYFTPKKRTLPILIMRRLLAPFKRLLFKYDYLR